MEQATAQSPPCGPMFVHTPFKDAANEVRLLNFHEPKADHRSIRVDITTWSFEEAPPYVAASYMWGSPEITRWIAIGGLPYEVRQNCSDALWQIRRQAPNDYIWIDSICINQVDLDEKALQVENMREIYSKAETVYSCIGDHADGSKDVLDVAIDLMHYAEGKGLASESTMGLDDHCGLFVKTRKWTKQPVILDLAWQRFCYLKSYHMEPPDVSPCDEAPTTDKHFGHALIALSSRPYWHRIWVVQEIYLARQCLVLCGRDWTTWEALCALMRGCAKGPLGRPESNDLLRRDYSAKTALNRGSLHHTYLMRLAMPMMESPKEGGDKLHFPKAFGAFRSWECSDPRDRLYALLGFVSGLLPGIPPSADYRITRVQIMISLLKTRSDAGSRWSWDTFDHVLQALGLTFADREIQCLLGAWPAELTPTLQDPRITSATAPISRTWLDFGTLAMGNVEIHAVHTRLSPTQMDESGKYCSRDTRRAVWDKWGVVFICPRVLPGDILCEVQTASSSTAGVVFRESREVGLYEFIGPALFPDFPDENRDLRTVKAIEKVVRPNVLVRPAHVNLRIWLEAEDMLLIHCYTKAYDTDRANLRRSGAFDDFLSYPRSRSGSYSHAMAVDVDELSSEV